MLEFTLWKCYTIKQGNEKGRGRAAMKKRYKYAKLERARMNGEFGEYLKQGISDKQRTAIIGKRIEFLRAQARMSQQDVSEIIGIAKSTYSGYELGQHEPSAETICRLAELFLVTTDFIIGKGYMTEELDNEALVDYMSEKRDQDFEMDELQTTMARIENEE